MEEVDMNKILKFDDEQIKSMELPMLRAVSGLYDQKHKEVSKRLEKLEKEINRLRQTLAGIKLENSELELLLMKRNQIYDDLSKRAHQIEQDFAKTVVMYPIYQFQIFQFLEDLTKQDKKSAVDETMSSNWPIIENDLNNQKRKLEDDVGDKQIVMEHFAKKYLEQIQ